MPVADVTPQMLLAVDANASPAARVQLLQCATMRANMEDAKPICCHAATQ
jgi:hypothetical protein